MEEDVGNDPAAWERPLNLDGKVFGAEYEFPGRGGKEKGEAFEL